MATQFRNPFKKKRIRHRKKHFISITKSKRTVLLQYAILILLVVVVVYPKIKPYLQFRYKSNKTSQADTIGPNQKSYQEVLSLSGEGQKKSTVFSISGENFKITFECGGSLCSAKLKSKNPAELEKDIKPRTADNIFYGSGEYWIETDSNSQYQLKVEDYK